VWRRQGKQGRTHDGDCVRSRRFFFVDPALQNQKASKQARMCFHAFLRHSLIVFFSLRVYCLSHSHASTCVTPPSLPSSSLPPPFPPVKGSSSSSFSFSVARAYTPFFLHLFTLPSVLHPAIRVPRIVLNSSSSSLLTYCSCYMDHLVHAPTTPTQRAQRACLLFSLRHSVENRMKVVR